MIDHCGFFFDKQWDVCCQRKFTKRKYDIHLLQKERRKYYAECKHNEVAIAGSMPSEFPDLLRRRKKNPRVIWEITNKNLRMSR